MLERLRRVLADQRVSPARGLLLGLGAAATAAALRMALDPLLADRVPFVTLFPALLVASLWGGRWGGLGSLLASILLAWLVLLPPRWSPKLDPTDAAALLTLLVSGGSIVVVSLGLRQALRDLTLARDRERLLVNELQHRVKNTLAIVQSLAAQTGRVAGGSFEAFLPAFTERLLALARVHDLLISTREGLGLRVLADSTLAPYREPGSGRIVIDGPPVQLSPEQAVTLALALHELATNAVKYGALSAPQGRVRLSWRVQARGAGEEIELEWRESGGPRVSPPERQGFGSRLLKQGLEGSARSRVLLDFAPEGLAWRAALALQPS